MGLISSGVVHESAGGREWHTEKILGPIGMIYGHPAKILGHPWKIPRTSGKIPSGGRMVLRRGKISPMGVKIRVDSLAHRP